MLRVFYREGRTLDQTERFVITSNEAMVDITLNSAKGYTTIQHTKGSFDELDDAILRGFASAGLNEVPPSPTPRVFPT